MKAFKIYNTENAAFPANALLSSVENKLGFIPNVFTVIAESAPALKAFMALNEQFANYCQIWCSEISLSSTLI